MDSGLTDVANQVVYQVIPEAYQPMVFTILGIAGSIFALVMFLWPFISKWSTNKQVAAINDSALSTEDIATAMEEKLKTYEKTRLTSEIANWKYKLIYANDETRPMIETEIARLEQEYNA